MSNVTLKNVRLSFPDLWSPKEFEAGDGKPRYGCALLVGKTDKAQLDKVKAAIREAGADKWGEKFADAKFRKGIKVHALRDGDESTYDGYEDHMFISANRSAKQGAPRIIDNRKGEDGRFITLTEADGRPYAGCYVCASVDFYASDAYGKTINASIVAVQFWQHGAAFAGGSAYSEDDFEEGEPEQEVEDSAPTSEDEDDYDPLA